MTGIVVPNNGTIGSASDTDAISIASDGNISLGAGIVSGNLGTITQRSTSNISGITFSQTDSGTVNTTNLFGTTNNIKPNGTTTATHSWLAWDYGSGNAKKINKIQWKTEDGTSNSNGTFLEGSNVASPDASSGHSDWTQLGSLGNLLNNTVQSYSAPANQTTKYRHFRIRWSWSSANYVSLHSFVLEDTDSTFDVRAPLNATGSAPIYACRAWVNFNGTGTVAIRNSGNVSSITDQTTGDYSVNFTISMPDVNYCTTQMCGNDADQSTSHTAIFGSDSSRTTSAVRFRTVNVASSGSTNDQSIVCIAVFR